MRSRLIVLVLAAAVVRAATAQTQEWRIGGNPDPLRAASLPFEPATAAELEAGEWRLELATTYVNLWQHTWQVPAIHEEYGREREPVASDELRELEQRYPREAMYAIDLEGWRSDLLVQRGFAHGLVLSLQVPYLDLGGPHWDGVAEWWHSALGFPGGNRDVFPRGAALLYVYGRGGTFELRDELLASGIGDVAVSLAAPLGAFAGGDHRVVASVEAPAGERGTLLGSGGWDLGVRWFGRWRWRTGSFVGGAGYTRLDPAGDLLGVERADTWHAYLGLAQELGHGWSVSGSLAYEATPLADFAGAALGEPSASMAIGVAKGVARRGWVALDLGQDWYGVGVSPDYAFRLSLGLDLGQGR